MPGFHTRSLLGLWSDVPDLKGRKVLDLSVGPGRTTKALLEMGAVVTATNYDPDPHPDIPKEATYVGGVDLNADLPFPDNSFDGINLKDVFEHLENPAHIVRECARILKPGGILVFSTPNMLNLASRVRFLFTGFHEGRKRPISYAKPLGNAGNVFIPTFQLVHYLLAQTGFRIEGRKIGIWSMRSVLLAPLLLAIWPATRASTSRMRVHDVLPGYMRRDTPKEELERLRDRQLVVQRSLANQMLTRELLFGRNLILRARKDLDDPFEA